MVFVGWLVCQSRPAAGYEAKSYTCLAASDDDDDNTETLFILESWNKCQLPPKEGALLLIKYTPLPSPLPSLSLSHVVPSTKNFPFELKTTQFLEAVFPFHGRK